MEDRGHHRVLTLVVLTAALLVPSTLAHAADTTWDTTVGVSTDPNQIIIQANTDDTTPGSSGTSDGSAGSGGPSCVLYPYVWAGQMPTTTDADGNTVYLSPWLLVCDGVTIGIEWLPPVTTTPPPPPPTTPPREVALNLVETIPVPRGTIEINPTRGLVGVESWFWIAGYDGSAIHHSTTAYGDLIEVRAWVSAYHWSFGDGSTQTSSTPGEAYPRRSSVRHTYQRSSDGHPAGYLVKLRYVFAVQYRVNGGAWITLPGITRSTTTAYPVRESQAVIER